MVGQLAISLRSDQQWVASQITNARQNATDGKLAYLQQFGGRCHAAGSRKQLQEPRHAKIRRLQLCIHFLYDEHAQLDIFVMSSEAYLPLVNTTDDEE